MLSQLVLCTLCGPSTTIVVFHHWSLHLLETQRSLLIEINILVGLHVICKIQVVA